MNIKRSEITSWIFPIILYIIYPQVGSVFIALKVILTLLKVLKKTSYAYRDTSIEQRNSQANEIKPHEIDFSHDHTSNSNPYGESRKNNKKTKIFDTEINVRCPVCNANNYVDELPTECEYCGNKIVEI